MASYVELSVTTDQQEFSCKRRFLLSLTVGELKKRVELLVGVPYNAMTLELRALDDAMPPKLLLDNSATLDTLSLTNGMILRVRDERAPGTSREEDFSSPDDVTFKLSDEKYNQKKNTLRAWLREQKLNSHRVDSPVDGNDRSEEMASRFRRCIVRGLEEQTTKPGRVAFIGEVHFRPGTWIGVHYDNPVGKNDGSVDGHRYFECPPNHGSFVRPQFVEEEAEEI